MSDNSKNKASYEALPDVEAVATTTDEPSAQARDAVRASNPGLKDREVDLLATLDDAVNHPPTFAMPSVNQDALKSQGESFLVSLLLPTVTVVCTTLISGLLTLTAQSQTALSGLAAALIPLVPYVNAVAVFASSYFPLAKRCTNAVEPLIKQMDDTVDGAERNVDALGTRVDRLIESIQTKVQQVLEPYRPSFAKAVQAETLLKQIDPDFDVPDPSDIDQEFDEAQGLVGQKIEQVKDTIDVKQVIPGPLRSRDALYWRIVVPVAVVACLLQLLLVALTHNTDTGAFSINAVQNLNSTLDRQSAAMQKQLNDLPQNYGAKDSGNNLRRTLRREIMDTANTDQLHQTVAADAQAVGSNMTRQYQDQALKEVAAAEAAKDAMVGNASQFLQNATDTVHQYETQAATVWHDVQANATAMGHELNDEYQQQKSQFLHVLLPDILRSYLMALFQLGFTYLLTSEIVKAWLVNRSLGIATHQVNKALDDAGVTEAVHDVVEVRLPRIRLKVQRALEAAQKLDAMLDQLGGVAQLGKVTEQVGKLADKMGDKFDKLGDKLGRFGKK